MSGTAYRRRVRITVGHVWPLRHSLPRCSLGLLAPGVTLARALAYARKLKWTLLLATAAVVLMYVNSRSIVVTVAFLGAALIYLGVGIWIKAGEVTSSWRLAGARALPWLPLAAIVVWFALSASFGLWPF